MLEKSEVATILKNFCAMSVRQFGRPVKTFRSDNGTEFLVLKSYFRQEGILHQTSSVDTPQQNGRVERKHRHILNVARACLFQANLPVTFWGQSILTAAHLINRTPTKLLNGLTPYELLHGSPPKHDTLRVFGCLCYAQRRPRSSDKFAARSRKCLFVGYPYGKKAWNVYDLEDNVFFTSRDVVFFEDQFPGLPAPQASPTMPQPEPITDDYLSLPSPVSSTQDNVLPTSPNTTITTPSTTTPTPSGTEPIQPEPMIQSSQSHIDDATNATVPSTTTSLSAPPSPIRSSLPSSDSQPSAEPPSPGLPEVLGRGHRQRTPSVLLKNYVVNTVESNTHTPVPTDSSSGSSTVSGNSLYPIANYVSDLKFSSSHKAFVAAITSAVEPKSYAEAVELEEWRDSMVDEHTAHVQNGTWEVTDLPPGKKVIQSMWLYKIKYHANGKPARNKSRLVACGNRQRKGLDYTDTFAPVAKPTTVRVLLAVAAAKQWEVHQMDVHNAFLHGDLEEEVYMKLPQGFQGSDPTKVARLKKSIYGLKQSPRCWFSKLSTALKAYGFTQSKPDYSHFSYIRGKVHLHILIYVDDFLIACNDMSTLQKFKNYLCECFHMKDLGKLKYFLGIEVARNREGFFVSQRKYALDIIADTGLLGCKPVATPIELNHKLALAKGTPLADPAPYRRLVGRLIYLTFTRPELSYSVHILSQFMKLPLQEHWDAALRVVRYLKGCPSQGILLSSVSDLQVTAYCDSDWSACPLTRRSLSSYIVLLGTSPVSWKTKKQNTVSASSAEAEYRCMAYTLRELKWLKRMLLSFGISHPRPMRLFCDSQSAIYIAQNPVFHERTKHIENDCHQVRDALEEKLITTEHISTKEQPADLLTKALPSTTFTYLLFKLGIQDISPPA